MPPKRAASKGPVRPAGKSPVKPAGKPAPKRAVKGSDANQKAAAKKGGKGGGEEEKKGEEVDELTGEVKKKKKKKRVKAGKRKRKKNAFQKMWAKMFPGAEAPDLNRRAQEIADSAMLNAAELRKLRLSFDEVDVDGEGQMDFDEFFEAVGETRTPFTDAVFTLLDDPASLIVVLDPEEEKARAEETGKPIERVAGAISFDDYVQLCVIYCMYTREDILMFAFQAFDRDGSGVIDEDEFIELCATINNMNPTYPGNFKRAMEEFDKNDDGMIDFEEFTALNRRYPLVLFPAFRLQDMLQKYSLGETGWIEISRRNQMEKEIEKYRRAHNGKMPPVPRKEKILRSVCCCLMGPDPQKLRRKKNLPDRPTGKAGMLGGGKKKKGAGQKKKYYAG